MKTEKSLKSKKNKYFVHKSAYVDDGVKIGPGTQIWHFCHILKGTTIGANCRIGQNVVIGPDVCVGNNVKIQNNVSVYKGVTLEDDVFCGPSCVFTNIFNPRSAIPRMHEVKTTRVRKGATIGANTTIVCGVDIGSFAFIGAGSVVTKAIAAYALAYGNPAAFKGYMCECAGEKLFFDRNSRAVCRVCKKAYVLRYGKVIGLGCLKKI